MSGTAEGEPDMQRCACHDLRAIDFSNKHLFARRQLAWSSRERAARLACEFPGKGLKTDVRGVKITAHIAVPVLYLLLREESAALTAHMHVKGSCYNNAACRIAADLRITENQGWLLNCKSQHVHTPPQFPVK